MTTDLTKTTTTVQALGDDALADWIHDTAAAAEKGAKSAVENAIRCGIGLIEQKSRLAHGEWLPWLAAHFAYDRRTATTYMGLAEANGKRASHLENAESLRDALRMIAAETPESDKPQRKAASVVVTTPDDAPEPDDDPAPKPPTTRKTSAATKKPKAVPVTAELVEPEPGPSAAERIQSAVRDLAECLGSITAESERKATAKRLRKLADELDPPTKFQRPDLKEVAAYFRELHAVDPDSFFDFYESKGWLVGKVSMKDWRASARKWVRENQQTGKGATNGHARNGRGRELTAEDVFSAESLGRGR